MQTGAGPIPEQNTIAGGLIGMMNVFIDPAATARRVPSRLFWVWPVVVLSIISIVVGYLMLPFSLQLADIKMAQQNLPAERIESARRITHLISNVIVALSPVFIVAFLALFAWLVVVASSVLSIRARFRDVFSLMAACALIPALERIASYIVIRSKGDEITSAEQMQPAFGLDIFTSGLHGPPLAILNFFSIFEIWYLVVLGLGFAYLTGSSKSKAFVAITPAWLLPLLFKIVGSLFSR